MEIGENWGYGVFNSEHEQLRLIHRYRYLSLSITSIFYFFGAPTSHWIFKIGVIAILCLSARITIGIYDRYIEDSRVSQWFILLETMGIILLLLPTGGLNSPFIWYALNPVLISASFLSHYFFWLDNSADGGLTIVSVGRAIEKGLKEHLMKSLKQIVKSPRLSDEILKTEIASNNYNIAPVKSASTNYGLIGFIVNSDESNIIKKEHKKQLRFISELSAVILERFHIDEVTERLTIAEEQNRIADEMHDSVSQGLFSISYATHSLIRNRHKMSDKQL